LRSEAYLTNRSQRPSRAVPLYEQSIAMFEECIRDHPADFSQRDVLGTTYFDLARILLDTRGHRHALPRYQKGIEAWESLQHEGHLAPERLGKFAFAYLRLGEVHDHLGHDDEAIHAYRACIQISRSLRDSVRRRHLISTALVDSLIQLADLLQRQGNLTEAGECRRDGASLLEELVRNSPDNLRFKRQLEAVRAKLLPQAGAATDRR
jgi:tetratricopeptide (TPR) repeat protein